MRYSEQVNPQKEKLTIETLRTFPGCEHYNDEEATEIVETIHKICHTAFELALSNKPNSNDFQFSIPLSKEETAVSPGKEVPDSNNKEPKACSACEFSIKKAKI